MPGSIVVRVDKEENTVEWYYNQKRQAVYKEEKFKIKDMKAIVAKVAVWRPGGIIEFI